MLRKVGLILLIITIFTVTIASCGNTEKTTAAAPTTTAPATTPAQLTTTPATPAPSPTPEPITITDDYGRTVTIDEYPQRIISLSPAQTEILFALGLGDRIVGVCDYSDYPPEATTKPNIGAYDTPNIEAIIAQEPDLVLASEEHEAETLQLESLGITVVAINPLTVQEVLDSIILIGKITGQDQEAASLVSDMQRRMDAITAKTSQLTAEQKPRVFYIIWHDPIWTVGAGTFHDELIQMAGGVNIAGDLSGYIDISLEAVIAANPQVIIAGVGMGTGTDETYQFVATDDRLADVDARVNGKIYSANMDIVSRPGPRLVDALEVFFSLIHPEMQ
ncbi:MAG: cobalamin-binding protein [Dehalococcoidales bacterium]|jgi:iron complex transport system substrate-binding protein